MTPSDFTSFYRAVHGHPPFPWQESLLEKVVSEGWPPIIALPTSSGKTSAIDVAVFHLALESGDTALHRKASLRIFFVIDRRVVVDEAAEHAKRLAQALLNPKQEIVRLAADALRSFGARLPLDVAVLRGGMYRDNTWADEPNQPLVCVSTVDQVGSRLLFRGYQVSDEAKSVHAGLIGNDSLIVVDEAHLSKPFLDTLAKVRENIGGPVQVSRGLQLVKMSATINEGRDPFTLGDADLKNPVLRRRLEASKPTELRAPEKNFEAELVRAAKNLAEHPNVSVIGIVVNTVAAARAVFEDLRKLKDTDTVLLTGRNRPHSSKQLWEQYKDRIAAKPDRVAHGRLYVVATQTVEVGANIDFDALVTESAPLDALRQRFGRLNRLGNRPEAHAIIVRRPKEDPVYREATAKTWDCLLALGSVDFGVSNMNEALKGEDLPDFNTSTCEGPWIFPKYFEMWAQTNPRPEPDPDVAPFLHGREALEDADIQVVWREDVLEEDSPENWRRAAELAPPVSTESLALPLGTLRRWLGHETRLDVTDIEGQLQEERESRRDARPVFIWRGTKNRKIFTKARDIRPGDVVVLPATYGGCDEFGWHPESRAPVKDIGDLVNDEMARNGVRKRRVRLDIFANSLTGEKEKQAEVRELIAKLRSPADDDSFGSDSGAEEKLIDILQTVFLNVRPRIDSSKCVAIWPKQVRRISEESQIQSDLKPEDQDDDSVGLERKITLSKHTAGVVHHTSRYASGCGLEPKLVQDLVLAAELHDLGKWDDRFQAWLCGGNATLAARNSEPLAKSDGSLTLAERSKAQAQAQYPRGARHESASVLLADASGELSKANDQELVLHLIGSHHGYGRPLLPFWDEDETETVVAQFRETSLETKTGRHLARFDSGWVDRFHDLNKKYGYWGLAYLETILRRADCVQSRKEQEES